MLLYQQLPPQRAISTRLTARPLIRCSKNEIAEWRPRGAIAERDGRHQLADGMELEVLSNVPEEATGKVPLVFIHGSVHGAWCWREHFLPYFAQRGYPSYALSLRGHGKSDGRELKFGGTLQSHAEDIASFAQTLDAKPVLMGHSFSGLFVQNMALGEERRHLSGVAAICSTPPSGNGAMIQRFLKQDFIKSLRITWGLLGRQFKQSPAMAQFLFFSEDIPEDTLMKYRAELAQCSPTVLVNVRATNAGLPLPPLENWTLPAFVLGAENDNLVDVEGIQETAEWYGVEPIILKDLAHDVMLDTRWEAAAGSLHEWLEGTF